jgi:hypothetical protein
MRTLALLIIVLALPWASVYAREAEGLAQALVKLRSEVERLNDQVEEQRRAGRDTRRALATQQTELDAEQTRAKLRVAQIEETLTAKTARVADAKAEQSTLVPVFEKAATDLKARIAKSLPFKRVERLKAVTDLEKKLAENLLTPQTALSRLWAVAEDELRLTRDTGLFRDTVMLPDGEVLADVIRIGMVGLYYRTGDERVGRVGRRGDQWVGRVGRRGDQWVVEAVTDEAGVRQIHGLFDAFKKQIRVGSFDLPGLLLGGGS